MQGNGPRPQLKSVVKVLTVSDSPDYELPWQMHGAQHSSGSGAIVRTERGLRVLTNAHVVMNQVFVEVRRFGESQKYAAEVEGVSHECDLALLKLKDEFFRDAEPVTFGVLPELGDHVTVCGYPIGGDRLSLTQGIVSRIEVSAYSHSQRPLLAIQIDAAINSGNSGGPVFAGDKLIGVAFQALDESQNIAYAIALPVVEHFLADLAARRPAIFPSLGVVWQRLESEVHRKSLGLARGVGGALVVRVAYESSAWGLLKEGDVILAIDGEAIGTDGTLLLPSGDRVDHSVKIALRYAGEETTLTLVRDKKKLEVKVKLLEPSLLVPEDRYDVRPTYFCFGGALFVPLTRDYLKSWGNDWWKAAPHELLTVYETAIRTPQRHDVVILQKVLADKVNRGYHEYENHIVVKVDGVNVVSMKHLVNLVEEGTAAYLTIELADGQHIILERQKARERTPIILERFNLRYDRSDDLRKRAAEARKKSAKRAAAKKTRKAATKKPKAAAKKTAPKKPAAKKPAAKKARSR